MSKKKAGGSTMTLKDFHGGSIPSDLPLPSAPGLVVRPAADRPGVSWGNQMGRPDNRSRPHTSPAARHFDDKAPFLSHTANIGRNFDEDERKPLDGGSAPRRAALVEVSQPRVVAEPKRESVSSGGSWGRQQGSPRGTVSFFSGARGSEAAGSVAGGGAHPNAWAARKESAGVVVADRTQSSSTWSAPNAVSKLAHASALDKVSSGRWHSKPPENHPADAEVVRSSELDGGYGQGGRKEVPEYERNVTNFRERGQPDHGSGKIRGADLPIQTGSEPSERPKLKLLPRTKPLDCIEPSVVEPIQGTEVRATDHVNEGHGNLDHANSGSVSVESEKQTVERPKLNLKPRSQPVEQSDGGIEGDRNLLFGGARPRELVLKERGVDDVVINQESVQHTERVEHHAPKAAEIIPGHANTLRHNERTIESPHIDPKIGRKLERREHEARHENHPGIDQRTGKKPERRDQRADHDMQRRNWRGVDNRRNIRESEKQQQQQPHQQPERAPSPETWRKPVEQPKPSSTDAVGPRYGKAASAVELATAFSKSSLSESTDRLPGQRNLPGRPQSQIPFSRLTTGPTPRPQPQINGY